ncbi:MAG: short-chain dehydrogenase [Acidobacteria bacterium]|nr:MAG: short-chain dehydrogenase [Acidobacteriota bacterium]PYY23284.1 MAG: short-chain dehydrogenase [Acidobacteriota bacterium]
MSNFQNGVQLSVAGKVALITGGSRGIGAATVKMFCAAGAKVAFNYKKAKDAADRVIAECGTNVCAIQSDLSSPGDAEQLIKVVVGNLGRLDCLVANHGIWPPDDAPVDEMPDDQWRRTIAVNLDSVFGLIKHGVAQMKSQRRGPGQAAGRIVIISSTAGQRGEAFHCDYAASKGAVISMVKGLSTELARDEIYVNCVAPGWVATDMAAPALENPKTRDRVFATIPLGRVGKPEEIAAPILFLCTDHAGFITGEILNVNGGAVLVG